MKGLRKYLTPFAPDQSGAVSVLYELGGIMVIIDAGGCAGNVCGFDEPRWHETRSAVFSAGLRDMDAIMGRDDLLVKKLVDVADRIDAHFIALVGTPVPSVIGTDYHGLKRMIERKVHLPVLALDCNGMALYDKGIEKAYVELVNTLVTEEEKSENRIGIIGLTPLDFHKKDLKSAYDDYFPGKEVIAVGLGSFEDIHKLSSCSKNYVVSISGLKAAGLLEKKYGIPYEVVDPVIKERSHPGKNVLIIHEQVKANSLRDKMDAQSITVAGWFMMDKEMMKDQDVRLREENDLIKLINENNYDVIYGDPVFKQMIPDYQGEFIPMGHFAVSGSRENYE